MSSPLISHKGEEQPCPLWVTAVTKKGKCDKRVGWLVRGFLEEEGLEEVEEP